MLQGLKYKCEEIVLMNRIYQDGRDDQFISYIYNSNTGTTIKFPVMPSIFLNL